MNPILLVGAALVGLPILLHLIMKQEPKRLPFPAFRFLKQRLKTNQRKLRLRHLLLLAMRMLLIALFCLTLYQPSILSRGLIDLRGPVAAVILIDTSPSMGYAEGERTNLEEACRRATELVNDLPDGSRIAVIETGDPGGDWLPSASDARGRIAEISKKSPRPGQMPTTVGGSSSVSASLAHAYQLLKTVDEQSDTQETLPRLVAVFTDRAGSSWDASRMDDLRKVRDAVSPPAVAHAIVDVGTDKPVNVGLLSAEMHDGRPQIVPANQPVALTVTVAATGLDTRTVVLAKIDDQRDQRKEVEVRDGRTQTLTFDFRDLKPGLHQARFKIETNDAFMTDNERYFTFRVAEPRRVLAITDDPGNPANGNYGDAHYWRLAINANREFSCDVVKPDALPADLGQYEVVTLLSVARPEPALWDELRKYVEVGGKLIVAPPGDDRLVMDAYNGEAASKLLPGAIKEKPIDVTQLPEKEKDRRKGVAWFVFTSNDAAADRELQHPLLAPIRAWKAKPDVDAVRLPRKAFKYWVVEPRGGGTVVATYDDDDDPAKRHPAVLERAVPKGRVLMLTTKLDPPGGDQWNDYWEANSSWAVAFPDMLLRYLAGGAADANFNHLTGATITLPLAKILAGKRDNLILTGPGILGTDNLVRLADRQNELRLAPPRTNAAGNYRLESAGDPPPGGAKWAEGFSLNLPPDESTFDKAPVEGIEDLTGKGSVIPVGKNKSLTEILSDEWGQTQHPIELFPWLLIAVLLLLVAEGFLANRFYRRPAGG
jgi:hypothetical protein